MFLYFTGTFQSPSFKFVGWSVSKTGDESVDFDAEITGNVEYFAIWNKVIDVKGLLKSLLDSYKLNPMDYLPESMRYDYSQNLIDPNDIPMIEILKPTPSIQ